MADQEVSAGERAARGETMTAQFAAIPVRAVGDIRLSVADFGVMSAIACYDWLGRNGASCYVDPHKLAADASVLRMQKSRVRIAPGPPLSAEQPTTGVRGSGAVSERVLAIVRNRRFGDATLKHVLKRLAVAAQDDGSRINISVGTLADDCDLSTKTIQRVLRKGERLGILSLMCRELG